MQQIVLKSAHCMPAQVDQAMLRAAFKPREDCSSRQVSQVNWRLDLWVRVERQRHSPKSSASTVCWDSGGYVAIECSPQCLGSQFGWQQRAGHIGDVAGGNRAVLSESPNPRLAGASQDISGLRCWELQRLKWGLPPWACPQEGHRLGKDKSMEMNNYASL